MAVGLVGAGPWASMVHAPVLAAGPETRLAGVWARRPEAAAALAQQHGVPWFREAGALFDACEAVAFAVPPDVQASLAARAATAGKGLLLEKPIAADLGAAVDLAAAVDAAGVASVVVLTWRYARAVRAFLDEAARFEAVGGIGRFLSGAVLGGPFATPWRLERGPLLDLGPHVVDLLDAALGTVETIRAHGNRQGWVGLLLEHRSGAYSEASLCATSGVQPSRAGVELHGPDGMLEIDCVDAVGPDTFSTVRSELAAAVRDRRPHPLDVHHGLRLQRLIAAADAQLR